MQTKLITRPDFSSVFTSATVVANRGDLTSIDPREDADWFDGGDTEVDMAASCDVRVVRDFSLSMEQLQSIEPMIRTLLDVGVSYEDALFGAIDSM